MPAKRCKRLTPAQREAIWAPITTNAGVGWSPRRYRGRPMDDRMDDPNVRSFMASEEFADRQLLDDPEKL